MNNNNSTNHQLQQQNILQTSSQDIIDIDGLLGGGGRTASYGQQPFGDEGTGEDDLMSLGIPGLMGGPGGVSSSNLGSSSNSNAIDLAKHPSGIIPTLQCVIP